MGFGLGGIAEGIETGLRISQSIQDRKERKEERDREFGLRQSELYEKRAAREKQDARQSVLDQRADADYQDKVADDANKGTVSEFANVISRYGSFDAAPPEAQARLTKLANETGAAVQAARTRRSEVAFGQQKQELSDIVSNLQTGRVKLEDVPSDKLYLAVANATGREPTDFMAGPNGAPSLVAKAAGDLTTGLETNNEGMVLSGANTLFAPELRKGVGTPSAHGGKIVGKEIIRIIPHPDNPQLISPVVRVYVDQGKDFKGPRGRHNETSYYDAPLTERRSSDPDDNVKFIDMGAAMNRVGQMGLLSEAFNNPDVRARLEEGKASAGSRTKELLDSYIGQGIAAAPKKQLTTTAFKLGADGGKTILRTTDAQGREVGRETLEHAPRERTFEAKVRAVDDAEESGDLSAAEADEMRKKIISGIGPDRRGGRGGSGGGSGKGGKITEAEVKGTLKDVANTQAGDMGLRFSQITKGFVQADGKPATAEQLAELNRRYTKAASLVRDNAAQGKKTGMSEALAAGAPPPKPAGTKTVKWSDLK